MNLLKRTLGVLLALVFSILVISPVALTNSTVSAQTTGYTITQVDHQIQIMYSGHIVVLDTIHVSGQVTDGFQIGLPREFSDNVLKGFAYDDSHQYQLNLGVQIGNQIAIYGAEVNFNGSSPSVFTVAFILDNSLITEQSDGSFTLTYPAYPSLSQDVGTANVNLIFPGSPTSLTITKDDGNINSASYSKTNLPAYTYSVGSANFKVPTATLQLVTISSLSRQITIDPTGKVTAADRYQITNDATSRLSSFVVSLPIDSQNIAITDGVGQPLGYLLSNSASGNIKLANVTLTTFPASGQTTSLIATYQLSSAILQGNNYVLSNFQIFPSIAYYVDQATATFNPPEGATIVSPQASELSSSSTLTRNAYQDTLAITQTGLSYVDYLTPEPSTLQLAYNYNPIWVSFRPTFWGALAAVIVCIGAVVYRIRKPKEETYAERAEKLTTHETHVPPPVPGKTYEAKQGQHVTVEDIKEFLDDYENKKQLTNELHSMDTRAQKGKIPRRQYKVQRQAIEIRIEGIRRSINRTKVKFRSSPGPYADLAKQLDLAEEDQNEAETNIKTIEARRSRGEISLENYKRSIGDYQKQRDKAESAINGILLRLREKIR